MVPDRLAGIKHGERCNGVVECFALPHVARDGGWVPGSRVRARKSAAAELSVTGKRFLLGDFANAAQSAILQRSKIELTARDIILGLAEKDIAGGLHHPLPFNHAPPLMPFVPQLAAEPLQ